MRLTHLFPPACQTVAEASLSVTMGTIVKSFSATGKYSQIITLRFHKHNLDYIAVSQRLDTTQHNVCQHLFSFVCLQHRNVKMVFKENKQKMIKKRAMNKTVMNINTTNNVNNIMQYTSMHLPQCPRTQISAGRCKWFSTVSHICHSLRVTCNNKKRRDPSITITGESSSRHLTTVVLFKITVVDDGEQCLSIISPEIS